MPTLPPVDPFSMAVNAGMSLNRAINTRAAAIEAQAKADLAATTSDLARVAALQAGATANDAKMAAQAAEAAALNAGGTANSVLTAVNAGADLLQAIKSDTQTLLNLSQIWLDVLTGMMDISQETIDNLDAAYFQATGLHLTDTQFLVNFSQNGVSRHFVNPLFLKRNRELCQLAADYAALAKASADAASEKAGAVSDRLEESLPIIGAYTLDDAGVSAFQADQASGVVTGDGPIAIKDGKNPVVNPLFFTYVGRNGNRYPITSDLLASVLNLLNLYPRP